MLLDLFYTTLNYGIEVPHEILIVVLKCEPTLESGIVK